MSRFKDQDFEESLIENDIFEDPDDIAHIGVKRRSGRYPWGSGINPYQHEAFFEGFKSLKEMGLSDNEIAEKWEVSTKDLRMMKSIAGDCARRQKLAEAKSLREDGYSNSEIARRLGYTSESSVRALFDEKAEERMNAAKNTADFLREQVDSKGMIDVGKGVEVSLGVSREKLDESLYMLEIEGYNLFGAGVKQVTNKGQQTIIEVIAPKDAEKKDIYNFEEIHTIDDYRSNDNGETFWKMEYPAKLSSDRLQVRYPDEKDKYGFTGADKDGLIEIRRGVQDLDLGNGTHYAQVRILCDGKKYGLDGDRYLKGMAVYSDDMPDGVDVIFNTSKPPSKNDAILKPAKDDPENPFGSTIKEFGQYHYKDKNGKDKLGLINKKSDEGDWNEWSKTLPSQFLSKQRPELIEKQLNLAIADKKAELEEIKGLDNLAVRKKLLMTYATQCDSQAVSLTASSLPRQRYQVILPVNTLGEHEIYAPNFKDGEKVALVRFPHGGTFEIPILTVNNKNKEGKSMLSASALDAVGISGKTASILSGADFDGDTVMVIPTGNGVDIKSSKPLKGLSGFDPRMEYPKHPGMKIMTKQNTQKEMGSITNLIMDMTIKGASEDELAAAVRHSMVVIDAHKHELDYRQSYADNHIADLKNKYQAHVNPETGKINYGAGTIITRAKSRATITKRKGSGIIDKETGEMIYKDTDRIDTRTGKLQVQVTTKMAATKNAFDLVSDVKNPVENLYANYANTLKQLANEARKAYANDKGSDFDKNAAKLYMNEVRTLEDKYKEVLSNKPKERKAQMMANTWLDTKVANNPALKDDKEHYQKEAQKLLVSARNAVGARRSSIDITPKEWEAIQAGAISTTRLGELLDYTDMDVIRKYATPKNDNTLSATTINRIKAMAASGYTNQEIANALGISISTVTDKLRGKE